MVLSGEKNDGICMLWALEFDLLFDMHGAHTECVCVFVERELVGEVERELEIAFLGFGVKI